MNKCGKLLSDPSKAYETEDGKLAYYRITCDLNEGHSGGCVGYANKLPEIQPPTLRDQFAIAALTGLIPLFEAVEVDDPRERMVTEAYAIADAMLIVRVR